MRIPPAGPLLALLLVLSFRSSLSAPWEPPGPDSLVVFEDDFSGYPAGALSETYTAVQEYHWTPKKPEWGPWIEAVYWPHWTGGDGLA